MRRWLAPLFAAVALGCSSPLVPGSTPLTAADDHTKSMVSSANAFLATLDATQKGKVLYDFTDDTQRQHWSNLPTGIFQRNGLRWGDMTAAQQDALKALLAATLSDQGYRKALDVMEGDEVLRTQGDSGNLVFGRAEYYMSLLGTPSETSGWMLQFGGHHLALNVTVAGSNVALTPSLPAAQPASYTLDGKTVRPLGDEVDKAFRLVSSLDATQKAAAVIGSAFVDLVLGPGEDGVAIANEGVACSTFTPAQQELLWDLASEWVGNVHDADGARKMAELKADLANTFFAWSGPVTEGGAAYFRITAPRLVIEYAPQSMGGDATNHTHTIVRDPKNDYGAAFLK